MQPLEQGSELIEVFQSADILISDRGPTCHDWLGVHGPIMTLRRSGRNTVQKNLRGANHVPNTIGTTALIFSFLAANRSASLPPRQKPMIPSRPPLTKSAAIKKSVPA